MQVTIFDKHMRLNDDQKDYVQSKIEHLKKYSDKVDDESTKVRVDVESKKSKISDKDISVQVTMYVPNAVIRAEVVSTTIEEGTDIAVDKLRKQIERYKTKQNRRDSSGKWIPASTLEDISAMQGGSEEDAKVAKRKQFDLTSMHEEEAIEQLELLGHDFYAFSNIDTGKYSVAYKREDGAYGVLEFDES
ncbi:ribosome hibernation-promoting factor, HPF/YfiA family [Pseudomonadota bacterium]